VQRWLPQQEAVVQFVAQHGALAMRSSVALRQACCAMRKLEPLGRLLQGRTAWVTGLRRGQSQARADVPPLEVDAQGRSKYSPLAHWSNADVWHYVALHQVPYNPLHDAYYPSIGCAPCTRAVALGEDERAGRWWWETADAKECGLHVKPATHEPALPVSRT
jgi:phosphoadenosine phosphosulfate reductase